MRPKVRLERLAAMMLIASVNTLGTFLVVALLSFYAQRYGATPWQVGALFGAFALAQTLTAPLWGVASDRFGRRPVLLLGLFVGALGYLVFGLAPSLWLLLVSRLAQGAGGGTVSVVFAYISDTVEPDRRAEAFGWVTAATSLAAMVGPLLGSISFALGPAAPGLLTSALCGATLLYAWLRLPEPETEREEEKATGVADVLLSLAGAATRVFLRPARVTHALIWIYAAGMIAWSGLTGIAALYLEQRFGVTERSVWPFFTYIAGLSLAVRVLVLGPVVDRFGEARVLRLGGLSLAVGLLLVPLPGSWLGLAAVVALVPIGTSLLFPCTSALISRHARPDEGIGMIYGVQQVFGGTSNMLGPVIAGALFERWGPGAAFLGAGGAVLVGLLSTARLTLGAGRDAAATVGSETETGPA